jgi:maltase-glucoamylase
LYSKNPFGLIVALDDFGIARGDLFYDDGDSIDTIEQSKYYYSRFTFGGNQLKMTINANNYPEISNNILKTIRIFGYANTILREGKHIEQVRINYPNTRQAPQVLLIENVVVTENGELDLNNLNLKMNQDFEIDFKITILPDPVAINDERLRVDCHPDPGSTQSACIQRGCSWAPSSLQKVPWCFISKSRVAYVPQGTPVDKPVGPQRSLREYTIRKADTMTFFNEDFNTVKVSVEHKGSKMIRIKFEDPFSTRYEVPVKTSWQQPVQAIDGNLADADLNVTVQTDSFGRFVLEVFRKSTGSRLISTREYAESYVFSDRYQHLYLRLATENVFGFGENVHQTFRHRFSTDASLYPIFARDEPPSGGTQALYGTQPFYLSVERDGSAHGLLIMNSNAQVGYRLAL